MLPADGKIAVYLLAESQSDNVACFIYIVMDNFKDLRTYGGLGTYGELM